MHTRTFSLQIQQPFSDTLAREPSFVSLLKYTSLRGFHALLDSSLTQILRVLISSQHFGFLVTDNAPGAE